MRKSETAPRSLPFSGIGIRNPAPKRVLSGSLVPMTNASTYRGHQFLFTGTMACLYMRYRSVRLCVRVRAQRIFLKVLVPPPCLLIFEEFLSL